MPRLASIPAIIAAALAVWACGIPASGAYNWTAPAKAVAVKPTSALIRSTVLVLRPKGHGTGVLIAPRLVLTARHVILDQEAIVVRLASGEGISARVLWQDARTDTAVLFLKEKALAPSAPLGCKAGVPDFDEKLRLIGHPSVVRFFVSRGHVGSIRPIPKFHPDVPMLILDITGYNGNSGGPVFDERGRVRGVLLAMIRHNQVYFWAPMPIMIAVPVTEICDKVIGLIEWYGS